MSDEVKLLPCEPVDWIIQRFKLKADFMRAAHRMFHERNAEKRIGA